MRRKKVNDYLNAILVQRLNLKLEFEEGVTSIQELSGTLLDYDDAGLTVEVSSLEGVSSAWEGCGISCFIHLPGRENEGSGQLLTFSSFLKYMQKGANGLVQFVLTLPDSIKSAQRRRSVRVNVDYDKIPVIRMWRELPKDSRIVPMAPLVSSESDARRGLRLRNISSIGLCLLLPKPLMQKALRGRINTGECFTIYFTALSQAETSATPFWVNAVLRNVIETRCNEEILMGFEFIEEASYNETNQLVWKKLKLDEVSGLGKFIFKWNQHSYRK